MMHIYYMYNTENKILRLKSIQETVGNPNVMDDEVFDGLVSSMRKKGWYFEPATVWEYEPEKYRAISGHKRIRAGIKAGILETVFNVICDPTYFGSIAKIYGYSGVGVDIWDKALSHSRKQISKIKSSADVEIIEMCGMDLTFEDNKFDYVYCNPPFMDIEKYSGLPNDIGCGDVLLFESKFVKLMKENYRVLKPDGLCTITMCDKREKSILNPLQNLVINSGLSVGFYLWDFVVAEVISQNIRFRKKAYDARRTVKGHEYVITFKK